ncbi:hypothetical protein ETQ85_22365 [Zoogloea oleivorans]|jgi:hypothetical protein|uniref:TnsE C-terminal domain-containing protein n=1 Tax=Zoogloea oleivorans TaxID=1552750 RepID=A0A6C2CHJ9_9RHOO|nr:hypothetical protein [Zoogloea oleivorans]TYC52735.1 hypothetical protein ETQ85_22365 [Zoogloea oleivorans]
MRRLTVSAFCEVDEPLEIHWLVGLEQDADGSWLLRVVTHGLRSGLVRMWPLPIGLFPLLSPGLRFEDGLLLDTQSRGGIQTAFISNLANGVEVTSADIPTGLYTFFGHQGGVQRIVRYETDCGEIFVPTMELVRYLLLHNKTLANAVMVPGQLMTLYQFEPLGIYEELTLRFTSDMPVRSISKSLALEFAWLAIHPEGRRTWDSVYTKSAGQQYVSLDLPDVPEAQLVFRGVRQGSDWLVLEIIHLTGRSSPCLRLRYGHPSFQRPSDTVLVTPEGGARKPKVSQEEPDVEISTAEGGTRVAAGQLAVEVGTKSREFTIEVPIKKIWRERGMSRHRVNDNSPTEEKVVTGSPVTKKPLFTGGVSRESRGARIHPLEFRTLESYPWDLTGDLQALAETIEMMADLISDTEISMSLCRLKPGRAFSTIGRRPRCCLVVLINVIDKPPVVLVDVDRGGEWALSTMVLSFLAPAPFADIDAHVKTVLDSMVDNGGHWDSCAHSALSEVCACRRLPKILPKRGGKEESRYRATWAYRLAIKLGLPFSGAEKTLLRNSDSGEVAPTPDGF